MDSSELTKFRRNRTEANSNNGQKATKPANKITQMSASSALNIFLGGRRITFDKRTILPNCGGTNGAGCNQDILDDGTLDPPNALKKGWVTNIGGSFDDRATAITMDKSPAGDYVLVTGTYQSPDLLINDHDQLVFPEIETNLFGSIAEPTKDSRAYVVKYDNTNGHAVWATKIVGFGGVGNTNIPQIVTDSIKTDSVGNVYVSGRITQTAVQDIYTVTFYDSIAVPGVLPFSTPYGSIRLSSSSIPIADLPKTDSFLVKSSPDGAVQAGTFIGVKLGDSPPPRQDQYKTSLTIDSNDDVWISGSYVYKTFFYGFNTVGSSPNYIISLTSAQATLSYDGRSGFIAKYSQDLTTLLAVTSIGIEELLTDTQITGIASYGTDVVVVGTVTANGSGNPNIIKFNNLSAAPNPPFILTSSGVPPPTNINSGSAISTFIAWYTGACVLKNKVIITSAANVIGTSIDVDVTGNIYIAGSYTGNLTFSNSGVGLPTGALAHPSALGDTDGFLIKYNTNSNPSILFNWATNITQTDNLILTVDKSSPNNYLVITGQFKVGTTTINNFSSLSGINVVTTPFGDLTSAANTEVFIVKYDGTGTAVWATIDAGANDDYSGGVTTDSEGNVVICGSYSITQTGGNLDVYNYTSVSGLPPVVNTTFYGYLAPTGASSPSVDITTDSFIAKYISSGAIVAP